MTWAIDSLSGQVEFFCNFHPYMHHRQNTVKQLLLHNGRALYIKCSYTMGVTFCKGYCLYNEIEAAYIKHTIYVHKRSWHYHVCWHVYHSNHNENAWALTHLSVLFPSFWTVLYSHTKDLLIPITHHRLASAASRRDVSWHHVTSNVMTLMCTGQPIWISENKFFLPDDLDLWPMTLPSNWPEILSRLPPPPKFWVSNWVCQTVQLGDGCPTDRNALTYRHNRFYILDHHGWRDWLIA